jgi:type III secretion protein U
VALARALMRNTRQGDYIPEPLFAAVATVLRHVIDLNTPSDQGGAPS